MKSVFHIVLMPSISLSPLILIQVFLWWERLSSRDSIASMQPLRGWKAAPTLCMGSRVGHRADFQQAAIPLQRDPTQKAYLSAYGDKPRKSVSIFRYSTFGIRYSSLVYFEMGKLLPLLPKVVPGTFNYPYLFYSFSVKKVIYQKTTLYIYNLNIFI